MFSIAPWERGKPWYSFADTTWQWCFTTNVTTWKKDKMKTDSVSGSLSFFPTYGCRIAMIKSKQILDGSTSGKIGLIWLYLKCLIRSLDAVPMSLLMSHRAIHVDLWKLDVQECKCYYLIHHQSRYWDLLD